jgi:antitoxin VapB
MQKKRSVRLFRNGRNQAVRIPREWEFDGKEVLMFREGDRLVIEPLHPGGLVALLAKLQPIDEPFPDVDDFDARLDEPELAP